MTVEFECPSCDETLRVGDEWMSKITKCPQCRIPIRIPVLEIPEEFPTAMLVRPSSLAHVPLVSPTAVPVQPTLTPTPSTFTQEPGKPDFLQAISAPPEQATGEFPFAVSPTSTSRTSRYKSRQQSSVVPWIIRMFFVAILGGVGYVGWNYYQSNNHQLNGSGIAEVYDKYQLPPVNLAFSLISKSQKFEDDIKEALIDMPLMFNTETFECELTLEHGSLEILERAGVDMEFVQVDLMAHAPIKEFYLAHLTEMEAPKEKEFQKAALFVAETFENKKSRRPNFAGSENIIVRDNLLVNACLGGLGYRLEATSGGKIYRCVRQDENQHLYFLVPQGTKSITIQERKIAGINPVFPANFQFAVLCQGQGPSAGKVDMDSEIKSPDTEDTDADGDAAAKSGMKKNSSTDEMDSKENGSDMEGADTKMKKPSQPMSGMMEEMN
jgi:hypothetical protein